MLIFTIFITDRLSIIKHIFSKICFGYQYELDFIVSVIPFHHLGG
jgi:hypothetical protein